MSSLNATSVAGARNWCVTILGHGGSPDQVCPDDDPAFIADPENHCDEDGLRWMALSGLAAAVSGLHLRTGGAVRLLYMQNCCKATVHTLLATAPACADFVLASPLILGVSS